MRQIFAQSVQFYSNKILVSWVSILLEVVQLALHNVGSTGNTVKFELFLKDHKRFKRIA
jgi:hypothetical protein